MDRLPHGTFPILIALACGLPGCDSATPPPPRDSKAEFLAKKREISFEGKTLPAWITLLKDPDADVRRQTAAKLATLDKEETQAALIPLLLDTLKDDDADVRQLSAFVISKLDPPAEVIVPLLAALRDKESTVRRSAATALVRAGRNAPDKLAPLLEKIDDNDDADVRVLAAYIQEHAGLPVTVKVPAAGQTAPRKVFSSPAEMHVEAVQLHLARKFDEAAALMKQAVAKAPGNASYAAYRAELEELAFGAAIDRHALKASTYAESSPKTLAKYLIMPARNDRDKVRAMFRWISDRIAYNAEGFLAGDYGDNRAEIVLKNRKGVCEGYANLFRELCEQGGVEVMRIIGYSKSGLGPVKDRDLHAWNAVKIGPYWYLLDITWTAGFVDEKAKKFKKDFGDYFFLTPPDQFIFSHLPEEEEWQLLRAPISKKQFESWPRIDDDLFRYGVQPADIHRALQQKPVPELVSAFRFAGPRITMQRGPLNKKLPPGTYVFRFDSPGISDMALANDRDWTYLRKKGTIFEGQLKARKGFLSVMIKATPPDYTTILEYVVE